MPRPDNFITAPVVSARHLSTKEAATYLNLSPKTLEHYRLRGGGPTYNKLGARRVTYLLADLDQWVERRRTTGATLSH